MPAAKGKRGAGKIKESVDDGYVKEEKGIEEESCVDDSENGGSKASQTKHAGVKKGKAAETKKEGETNNEIDDIEDKNGKLTHHNDEVAAAKPGPKSRGRAAGKKPSGDSGNNGDAEEVQPSKKAPKRGGAGKKDSDDVDLSEQKQSEESVKPKKVAKKGKASDEVEEQDVVQKPVKRAAQSKAEEVISTRRGGDRAVKKVKETVEEAEEKPTVKKGRGAKAVPKNGVSTKSEDASAKEEPKKRGRQAKKGKEDVMETESGVEASEDAEKTLTVAVEHCKS